MLFITVIKMVIYFHPLDWKTFFRQKWEISKYKLCIYLEVYIWNICFKEYVSIVFNSLHFSLTQRQFFFSLETCNYLLLNGHLWCGTETNGIWLNAILIDVYLHNFIVFGSKYPFNIVISFQVTTKQNHADELTWII